MRLGGPLRAFAICLCFGARTLLAGSVAAQTPSPAPSPTAPQRAPGTEAVEPNPPHRGQILIQSHGESPSGSEVQLPPPAAGPGQPVVGENVKADVSDEQRGALTFASYDLDARVNPARSGLSVRARVVVRNAGAAPLPQIALQISSTLHWESATLLDGTRRAVLPLAQHRLDTDADHTGAAMEAVLPLPEPLAPGASASLDLFYTGTLAQSAGRLARLGASAAQGGSTDWDGIGASWTGLRGFGNVLWYPVAAPQLFLTEGNSLFAAVNGRRLGDARASVRLRLSVEYVGEPPYAAYFCGRRATLIAVADDPAASTATGAGIATAEFPAEPLGFRLPSLFVLQQQEVLLPDAQAPSTAAGLPAEWAASSSSSNPDAGPARKAAEPGSSSDLTGPIVALVSSDAGAAAGLGAAAAHAASLLAEWLGPRPLSVLTVLDHSGQPFQDGPLLVAPAATLQTSPEAPALVYSLTHAWVQTGQPWMDEGLAQFFALLWVERESGRQAALAQLTELMQSVALTEPNLTKQSDAATTGQPLIGAYDELYYRRKAAAVWWMLRDVAGEKPLRAALSAWRTQPVSTDPPATQAQNFEHLLERLSGRDLSAFFADWVLRDRGLPDLSIADVQISQTPAGPGHSTGWLVAVTVRNDGGAVADVPMMVQSGRFATTERIRVDGFSQVTTRVLFESQPTDVTVNDGSTPEQRTSTHTRQLDVQAH